MEPQPITTTELVRAFRRYWIGVGLVSLLAAAAAYLYVLLRPTEYRGEVALQVTAPDTNSRLGALAVLNQNASTPIRVIKGVLDSERSQGAIIEKFNLDWKKFGDKYKVIEDTPSNQLVITYDDQSKQRILDVLEFTLVKLREIESDLALTLGSRQATALENAVTKKAQEVKEIEERLLKFQNSMRAPSDPTDPKSASGYLEQLQKLELELGATKQQLRVLRQQVRNAVIEAPKVPTAIPGAKDWQRNLQEAEYQLRIAKTRFNDEHPDVKRLSRAVEVARKEFQAVIRKYLYSVDKNLDPNLAELEAKRVVLEFQTEQVRQLAKLAPGEALQLSRLVTELGTVRAVYKELRAQYEQAKVDSEVARVRWQILDKPYIHRRPTNKQKLVPTLAALIGGFALAMVFATARYRKASVPPRS